MSATARDEPTPETLSLIFDEVEKQLDKQFEQIDALNDVPNKSSASRPRSSHWLLRSSRRRATAWSSRSSSSLLRFS
jgi:hypothetical protein